MGRKRSINKLLEALFFASTIDGLYVPGLIIFCLQSRFKLLEPQRFK